MDTIEIRQEIISRRKELGLTQADLAVRAGVTREMVSRFEGGRQDIGLSRLVRLCLSLDMELIARAGRGRPVFEDIDAIFGED